MRLDFSRRINPFVNCLFFLFSVVTGTAGWAEEQMEGLVVLKHAGITLGIKLDAGARVMVLQRTGGNNVLKADPEKFACIPPDPSPESPWIPFNGHITWIGPQESFWLRNRLDITRRKEKVVWPPDPYITYGRFHIMEQSAESIVLEGMPSPVSGVNLRKEFRIHNDGRVWHQVTATNTSSVPVSLNLWSNTRVDGNRLCCVQIPNSHFSIGITIWTPFSNRELEWDINEGWFYFKAFESEQLPLGLESKQNKAKLFPSCGAVFAIGKHDVLLKQFKPVKEKELFPGQGAVEIYQRISKIAEESIAELEFYGTCQILAPGQSTSIEEVWTVIPYDGTTRNAKKIEWLKNYVRTHPVKK